MKFRSCAKVSIAIVVSLIALYILGAPQPARAGIGMSTNIDDYVASKLDDFTCIMHVNQHDDRAGEKINKDFGLIYKIKGDINLRYKDENKLRIDGHIGASKAIFIVNGTKQYVQLSVGFRHVDDLGSSPGKRKTLLDMGMISSGYLAYTEAKFLRSAPVDGVMCAVFRISYRNKSLDTSHRFVWIDPKTKITFKREEYSQEGKLNATFFYRKPFEVSNGVWFPSIIDVMNNENQKAGETAYRNVKINLGLSDNEFKL